MLVAYISHVNINNVSGPDSPYISIKLETIDPRNDAMYLPLPACVVKVFIVLILTMNFIVRD